MPKVNFKLNGQATSAVYESGMSLLDVLREVSHVTSIKDGCSGQGFCGACTVLLDGKPVLSCLQKPENVENKGIITLEGIPERERRILSESFVKEGAIQCGFCTPGLMIRTKAFLDKKKNSTRQEKAKALSAHLCRCTGYLRILDAMETAENAWEKTRDSILSTSPRRPNFFGEDYGLFRSEDNHSKQARRVVGTSLARYRGIEMAVGEKPYVNDMRVPGMLHGAALFSKYPRARVLSINTADAQKSIGVVRIFTAEDVSGERVTGHIIKDWPVFVAIGEETRCVGDILALVVADTRHRARKAASLIDVSYEPLSPVTDPEKALLPSAPKIHERGNLLEVTSFKRGDVETALKKSPYVFKKRFRTQRIEHAFLEVESCLAVPVLEVKNNSKRIHIYSQGQGVHDDQRQIAEVLGLKTEEVVVELVTNGGAFGGKEDLSIQAQTALATHLLKKPVKTTLSREESMLLHPKRHPLVMDYEVAANHEGLLTGARIRIIGDTGAYASVGMKVLERAAGHSCGPYYVPNVDVEAKTVYTNNPTSGAMRGFGVNQTSFAFETMLNMIAEAISNEKKAKIDGYDIREKNILRPGDSFATGQKMGESCQGLKRCLDAVKDAYKKAKGPVGISCGIKNTGIGNGLEDTGRVMIKVLPSEKLEIITGYTEMGQGLFTILIQVVSDITGLPAECMSVKTVSLPETKCGMTTASRATALDSMAAKFAAEKLAKDLLGEKLGKLEGREYQGEYICNFTTKPGASLENPVTHLAFSFAAQVAFVDERGKVSKILAAHDVGYAINPLSCVGQIEGAIHMGLGHTLKENFSCTDGKPDSLLMKNLGIIKAQDMPEVDVILIEEPDPVGGYGSKGVGEIGLVPTAGAVAEALYQFDGKRRFELPLQREGDKSIN